MPATRSKTRKDWQPTRPSPIVSRSASKSSSVSLSTLPRSKSSSKALSVLGGVSKILWRRKPEPVFGGEGSKPATPSGSKDSRDSPDVLDTPSSEGSIKTNVNACDAFNMRFSSDSETNVPDPAVTNTRIIRKTSSTSSFSSAANCDEVDSVILAGAAVHATLESITIIEKARKDASDVSVDPKGESRTIIPLPTRSRPRAIANKNEDARFHGRVGSANPTRVSTQIPRDSFNGFFSLRLQLACDLTNYWILDFGDLTSDKSEAGRTSTVITTRSEDEPSTSGTVSSVCTGTIPEVVLTTHIAPQIWRARRKRPYAAICEECFE